MLSIGVHVTVVERIRPATGWLPGFVDADAQLSGAGALEQRPRHGDGDPVTERVLDRTGLEPGRQAGQHGRVTERVTGVEQIEQLALVRDIDRAAVDDAQERDGAAILAEDDRAGEMELDLGLGRDLTQFLR